MKGGYKIIGFKLQALTSGIEKKIPGAYEAVDGNLFGKATLISGLVVNDEYYPDFFAPFVSTASGYESTVVIGENTITIVVAPGDNVTVTVASR